MIREIYVLPINYFFPVNNTYVNTIKIIKICNFLNVKVEKNQKTNRLHYANEIFIF